MFLSKIKISNFRGIKSAEVSLSSHCVLLGSNNSGKTSIIDAISFLLGRERMIRGLGDYDFFGGKPLPQDRIQIKGIITGFDSNDPLRYPQWFNTLTGGTPIWLHPETGEVKSEYVEDFNLGIEIAFCVRFDEDELDYEYVRYFVDADTDPFEDSVVSVKAHHLKDIGFFLVPSKRNWERTISFGSELFKKVIKFQNAIPGKTVCKTRDDLRGIEDRIEKQEPLKTIVDRINRELTSFVNTENSGLNFIPTTGDIEGILQSLTPYLSGNGKTNIPIGNHGSGLISLQTLLLLLEFGRYRNDNGSNFILAAEEPELHLQPGLHRRLVGRIRSLSNQSIVTTHSPQIASYYKPQEIQILRNDDGTLKVLPLLNANGVIPQKNPIIRLYTIHRAEICEALMNKSVLLPEGLTEYYWVKSLMGSIITAEGWGSGEPETSGKTNMGILPTQDSHVDTTYSSFCHLIDQIVPLVDGDGAGDEYVKKLLKVTTPPKAILQLQIGWDLEKIIAWIISDKNDEVPDKLKEMLAGNSSIDGSLYKTLKGIKVKWDAHEIVVDFVATNNDCSKRARLFVDSLCNKGYETSSNWKLDLTRSLDASKVYVFQT